MAIHAVPLLLWLFLSLVYVINGSNEDTLYTEPQDPLVGPAEDDPPHHCPRTPDPLGLHRVDCYPEGDPDATACKARGCCWAPRRSATAEWRGRVPRCFFPMRSGYVMETTPAYADNVWTVLLGRRRDGAPSLYGNDWRSVGVRVEQQTDNRLRIKFYDADEDRFEVPFIKIQGPGASTPLYSVQFTEDPFSVQVLRKSTGTVIFDSSMGGLVLSDQFLQISSKLPSSHLYGFGEHVHSKLKHDLDWRTWSMFAAGKHPAAGKFDFPAIPCSDLQIHCTLLPGNLEFPFSLRLMFQESKNLYGVHPVYMNIENDGNANMVLLLNQHAMDVVLQPTPAVTFRTIGGVLDFYVFLAEWQEVKVAEDQNGACSRPQGQPGLSSCELSVGQTLGNPTPPVQVIQHYQQAVGLPMMPPYWGLGFQLCRWKYAGSDDLRSVIQRTRDADIPYDVQWGDIDYMDNGKSFTIDPKLYPDLPDIVEDLHKHGQKYVAIHDPGIKKTMPSEQYSPYDDGCHKDIWIKQADGSVLEGEVWPGVCVFADYTNEETITWWVEHAVEFHKKLAFDGFWIDMNEPKTFKYGSSRGCETNRWNSPPYVPKISGGLLWNMTLCMDSVQALGKHYDLHSLYGHSMINATARAADVIFEDKRYIIVSRSTFVGSGRFAGKWLGDNKSSFLDLKYSITGMLEFSMFGFPYVGADICGFMENSTEQLCQRWTQVGAFYPFARNHNINYSQPQDPGAWSDAAMQSTRRVLHTRYRLLPYLYTLFHLAHTTGASVARALAFEFPVDQTALTIDEQFLWGPALLISPVLTNNTFDVRAYFPEARWFNFFNGEEIGDSGAWHTLPTDLSQINLHVRGGFILPMQQSANTTYYSRQKPISLLVAYGEYYHAEGMLYWDDGETKGAHLTGDCRIVHFYATQSELFIQTSDTEGSYDPQVKLDSVVMYGMRTPGSSLTASLTSQGSGHSRAVHDPQWDPERKVLQLDNLDVDLTTSHTLTLVEEGQ